MAPLLGYPGLLVAALLGGLLAIPVFSTVRQSLAALVPEEQRKAAYSIDSMSVEVSFMVGPAVAVLAVTQISTRAATWLIGVAIVLTGVGLWGAYSLAGGFVYGILPHSPHALVLAGVLGLATIPIGLATSWGWLCLLLIPAGALCAPTLAATADAVSRLVPPQARGEAMGLYGSALTVGLAAGAPGGGRGRSGLGVRGRRAGGCRAGRRGPGRIVAPGRSRTGIRTAGCRNALGCAALWQI